jgi:hypothetical protein
MIPLTMNEETIPDINESRLGIRKHEGHLNYFLDLFGDHIAQREGYGKYLRGMDAVHFHLVHKFGWLPRDVKSMSLEDVRFVLCQEMEEYHAEETGKTIREGMLKGFKGDHDEEAN